MVDWVTTSGATSENEWQLVVKRMLRSESKWCNEWHQVTTHDIEWQRMTTSNKKWQWVTANDSSWYNRVILSFKIKQKATLVPEEFYSMFYVIYNYIFNIICCVSIMKVFFSFFSLLVLQKLLKHVKLIIKCKLLFENIIYNYTSVFD